MKTKTTLALALLLAAGCGKKENPIIERKPLSEWLEWLTEMEPVSRRRAAATLGSAGAYADQVVGPLAKALEDSDIGVRVRAAESLAKIGAPAVPTLSKLVSSSDQRLRVMAAVALARADPTNEKVIPVLTEAALLNFEPGPRGENLPTVENLAEESLRGLGAKAVPALCQALKHDNANVRMLGGRTLLAIGPENSKEALPYLEAALHDKYEPLKDLATRNIHRWRPDGRKEESKAHKSGR